MFNFLQTCDRIFLKISVYAHHPFHTGSWLKARHQPLLGPKIGRNPTIHNLEDTRECTRGLLTSSVFVSEVGGYLRWLRPGDGHLYRGRSTWPRSVILGHTSIPACPQNPAHESHEQVYKDCKQTFGSRVGRWLAAKKMRWSRRVESPRGRRGQPSEDCGAAEQQVKAGADWLEKLS